MSTSSNTARPGAAGLDVAPAFGWTLACVAATGLHAALLWHLATRPPVLIDPIGAPAVAVEIDLEPVVSTPDAPAQEPARTAEVAPAPPEAPPVQSAPPEPPQPDMARPDMARPEPPLADMPPPETVAEQLPKEPPPPEMPPEPEKTATVQPAPPPEPAPPEPTPSVPAPPEPALPIPPDAAVLPPPPAPAKPVEAHKPPPKRQSAERRQPEPKRRQPERPTPPRVAETRPAPAPTPAVSSAPSSAAATAAWKERLSSHLNRHKRFPPGAGTGVSVVAFTIGASGDVVSARLVRSSGDPALDAEATALPRRASPLPSPPAEVARGGSITLSVPVRFSR